MDRLTRLLFIGMIISVLLVVSGLADKLYLRGALHLGSAVMIGWVLMAVLIVTGMAYSVVQSFK